MKSKLNPISVGTFVIGAIILIAIGLMSFQSLNFFNKPIRFVSYFDQSVQGLGIGSDVKMRGVLVGRIVGLSIYYDSEKKQSSIEVIGELTKNVIVDHAEKRLSITNAASLEELIKNGLRAQIDLAGITGMQFMQLDFFPSKKESCKPPLEHAPYIVVPTVDSGMSQFTDNLFTITEKLSKIDIAGISNDLKTLLCSLNKKTEELDLKKMSTQINDAAEAIEDLAHFLENNPSSLIFGRWSSRNKKR